MNNRYTPQTEPLVSIIIPTYNRAADLKRALNSVMAQTYAHWECLIIDNHSADHTDDIIRHFNDSRIKLFKIHNQGIIAASRNLGIKHAQGQYIAFLDSDDWWKPEKLQKSIDCLEQGADIVYHDLHRVKKPNQRLFLRRIKCRTLKAPVYSDLLKRGNGLANSSVVLNAKLMSQIKGFSEDIDLIAIEDFEGWCRIAKLTNRFHYISTPLGYYWSGGGNASSAKRAVVNLIRFQTLHLLPFLEKRSQSVMPLWWQYAYARALYLTGNYRAALSILHSIQQGTCSFIIKLKIMYMQCVINIKNKVFCE